MSPEDLIATTIPGYSVDPKTRSVLNTNPAQYRNILSQRESSSKIYQLQNEIKDIKSDIKDILSLLKQIIPGDQNA